MSQTTVTPKLVRTQRHTDKTSAFTAAVQQPFAVVRELNNRMFYHFLEYFWPQVSAHTFQTNWHIRYLCDQLQTMATQVGRRAPREYDLIINVPPGSTKTITCSIMFPAWCWTRWPWMRFICASYSKDLSLESAEYCRDLVHSVEFREVYPDLAVRDDKNTKSNFRVAYRRQDPRTGAVQFTGGGGRYSTSVGGTLTGFHGDILIVDDPLNPRQAVSEIELANANHWMEQTLSTRKTDKAVTPTILIMQRLHQDDPSGHTLAKRKDNLRHICLPGEIRNYAAMLQPPELAKHYVDDLLDAVRLPWSVLTDLEADLGQYGYAGQVGQNPTPPGGGMFRVDHFQFLTTMPERAQIEQTIRYWDKASQTAVGTPYTVGVRMSRLRGKHWVITDVKRGRWSTNERERIIYETAVADGTDVIVYVEQEPGSGGKESAEATIRNLSGYIVYAERPTGDKALRADPYSVQVNNGNVALLVNSLWNRDFIDEHRFFPHSTYKDQVDAAAGAFNRLAIKRTVRRIT